MADKKEERLYLSRLAHALGNLRLKSANDFEKPDFVLPTESQVCETRPVLGIEFAKFFADHGRRGSLTIRSDSWFEEFCKKAEGALRDRLPAGGVSVYVDRRTDRVPTKQDISGAVAQLVEMVKETLAKPLDVEGFELVWPSRNNSKHEGLSMFAREVRVRESPGVRQVKVVAPAVGHDQESLGCSGKSLIAKKEDLRATEYVKWCSATWLVLVATGRLASLVDLNNFDASGVPPNGFERIYLLDSPNAEARLIGENQPIHYGERHDFD